MRRRALLAASGGGGGQSWACELHFTPEWEGEWFNQYAGVYGDFSEVFDLLTRMIQTIGTADPYGNIYIDEIPEEVNITVDGERLSYVLIAANQSIIELDFGNGYCGGSLDPTYLDLYKYI